MYRSRLSVGSTGRATMSAVVLDAAASSSARISPDGGRVVFQKFLNETGDQAWVHQLDRGTTERVSWSYEGMGPIWAP